MAIKAMNREGRARSRAPSRLPSHRGAACTAVTAAALSALLLAALTSLPACQSPPTVEDFPVAGLLVNGRVLETEVPAIVVGGEAMVPIEAVDVALGTTSTRDPATGSVNIVRSELQSLQSELDGLRARIEDIEAAFASSGNLLTLSSGVVMEKPYALACCNGSEADILRTVLGGGGLMGGAMRIIASNISDYAGMLANVDSVFLINCDYEPLYSLKDWPESASHILPFTWRYSTKPTLTTAPKF